jgi:hypothetical protein
MYINARLIADLTWRVLRGAGNSEVGRTNQLTSRGRPDREHGQKYHNERDRVEWRDIGSFALYGDERRECVS